MTSFYTVFQMETDDFISGDIEGLWNYSDSYGVDSNLTSSDECYMEESWLTFFQATLLPLVYSLVFVLGVVGNGLMVAVLLRRRRDSLRITEIYLLHLGLADLLFLAVLPFVAAQKTAGWVFGVVLCKLLSAFVCLNLLCGSLLLACISFDRYLAIVHAIPSMHNRRPRTVHLTCALLWILCLGLSAPELVFTTVVENSVHGSQCSHGDMDAGNWMLLSRVLTHLLGFFLPLVVMGYCYTTVVLTLCRHSRRSSLEKQGAVRLALLVTAVFCVCWLPYNITKLLEMLVILGPLSHLRCDSALMKSLVVSESLGYVHCCLNPILYAFAGVRFRKDLLRLLGRWRLCHNCVPAKCSSGISSTDGVTTTTNTKIA